MTTNLSHRCHASVFALVIVLITLCAPHARAAAGYAAAVQADGPIAYWRFNDAPPTAVNSGNLGAAANGTYTGSATAGAQAPRPPAFVGFEAANTALQCDGATAFVTAASLMNGRPVWTISGWMRRNGPQPNRTGLWGQNDIVEFGYIDNTSLELWTDNGLHTCAATPCPAPIPDGEWAHLAVVSDGSPGTAYMYTNGVLAGTRAHTLPADNAFPFNIGGGGVFDAIGANGNYFNGQIDEVAIFNKALTAAQIAAQYRGAFVPMALTFDDCTTPSGTALFGSGGPNGTIGSDGTANCAVHLTDLGNGSAWGAFRVGDLVSGNNVDKIHVRWRSWIGGETPSTPCGGGQQFGRPGADGYSFNWAADLPNPPAYGNPGEEGAGTGISVTLDTWDNGSAEAPGIEIRWKGQRVAFDNLNADQGLAKDFLRKNTWVDADLNVDVSGLATFTYDGRVLSAQLAGWTGIAGGSFMFGARTGGACDNHWIDDVLIEAFSPGRPFVTRQPTDQTVRQGLSATFSATADGTPPLNYQWFVKKATDADFTAIPGANAATYVTPATVYPDDDNSQFKLRVSNGLGTTESQIATLHINQDVTSPTIVAAHGSADFLHITLVFSEELQQGLAEDNANYSVDGGLSVGTASLGSDRKTVTLTVDAAQTPNTVYTVTVENLQDLAGNTTAPGSTVTFTSWVITECAGLKIEFYSTADCGTAVNGLTSDPSFPNNPFRTATMTRFDTRDQFGGNDLYNCYGARIRGLFIPDRSGDWVFYLGSDDASRLFLNPTGPSAAGKVLIAEETGCCKTIASIRSGAYPLQAGVGYYIEGLYKEGGGGDYMIVVAKLASEAPPTCPDGNTAACPEAIPGALLGSPAAPANVAGPITVVQPPADQTVEQNRSATFCVQAENPTGLLCYQWSVNGSAIPGANKSCYTTPPAQLADEGTVYSVTVGLIGAPSVTASAVLHVFPDTTPPSCVSASAPGSLSQVVVVFSEPLESTSATDMANYQPVGGLDVVGASLDASGTQVTLNLNGVLNPATTYAVTASDINDLAGNSMPGPCTLSFQTWQLRLGGALRQIYQNIGGGISVSDLTGNPKYPNNPDIVNLAEMLEGPIDNQMQDGGNIYDNYGMRISGYLMAPVSGSYNFFVSSDDRSEFWLSTDARPINKVLTCREPEWNGIRNWTGAARRGGLENQSTTLFPGGIPLVAGQLYYFETLMKEGGGGDNLEVTWQTPASGPSPGVPVNADGVDGSGSGGNGNGGTKAIPGRYLVTLVPPGSDTTPPSVVSAKVLAPRNQIVVSFSEIVRGATAENLANYAVSSGATITAAALRPDQRSVVLTASADIPVGATLTVNNVEDGVGNPVAAGTSVPITIVGGYLASGPQNLIVIEAEHFADVQNHPGLKPWSLETSNAGYSGDGYAEILIDGFRRFHGNTPNLFADFGARADYVVNFPVAGTYYLWTRGATESGSYNSFHMGLDGVSADDRARRIGNRINNWGGTATAYGWINDAQTAPARIDVAAPGLHTINIWPREDHTRIDKLVLTTDAAYTLAGVTDAGPPESRRQDTTPPVLACPAGVTVECAGGATPVTWVVSATDDVDGPVPVICTPPSGSAFPLGPSDVVCTASDAAGNHSSCHFVVAVLDTVPPRLDCPGNLSAEAADCVAADVIWTAGAFDDCGLRSFNCSPNTTHFPVGTTTVACTAVDAAGNSNSCSFTVTVTCPNLPPVCDTKFPCTWTEAGTYYAIAVDNAEACVVLDGSGSTDPDVGDTLTFTWIVDGTNTLSGAVVTNCLPTGCHSVVLEVSDGRASSRCERRVCVITGSEAVDECITLVENSTLVRKNKRPLIASLKAAGASFERGSTESGLNQLHAFQNKVRAQIARGNPAEAAAFTACAQKIIDAINCSSP